MNLGRLGFKYYILPERTQIVLGELASLGLSFTICKMDRGGIANLPT